jgi:hypothetical protein
MRSMVGLAAVLIVLAALGGDAMQADREHAVQLAIDTLSKHLKVETSAIRLISAEEVDWPDSSLGCPEKGMVYMQVITPGFRVRLEAGDRQYEVHTGRGRAVVCGGAK